MEFGGINLIAVLAAAVAAFIGGALWYGLLAKQWMKAASLTDQDLKQSAPLYIMTFICQLIIAWVLAGLIGHLGEGQVTLRNAIISAGFVWFGFILTTQIVNHRFQGKPWSLTLIDCGHWLFVLIIQGVVIGSFGIS